MTEESNQNQKKEQSQVPSSTSPVSNNEGDKKVNSQSGGQDSPKKTEAGFNIPQPFIVKEEKEQKRWWKRRTMPEFISLFALFISIYAVTLNKCSLDNTTRALAISDSTFKSNRIKDSNAAIASRIKDSLYNIDRMKNFTKDSINTNLNKQSLQEQINSLNETRKQFVLESRAFISIGDITLDTNNLTQPFDINFKVTNIGKFPANIILRKLSLYAGTKKIYNKDAIMDGYKIVNKDINDVVSNSSYIPTSASAGGMTIEQERRFKNGDLSFFLVGEIQYISLGIERKYSMMYSIKITKIPRVKILGFETIEYSHREIK